MKPPTFTARIIKVGVLRSVIVPPRIVAALGGDKRIAVVVRYGGETRQSTLVPAGGAKRRLTLQMDVLRTMVRDAGDRIEITLSLDASPRPPPLPVDLQHALRFRPAAAAELARVSPSSWRIIVAMLEDARTPETRQRRLESMVERLAENAARRSMKIQPKARVSARTDRGRPLSQTQSGR